jgi:hypothetical protein
MDSSDTAQAVLAEVTCSWGEAANERLTAVIVHAARDLLVLEAPDPHPNLPPLGANVHVKAELFQVDGHMAEVGRAGRFLVAIGDRPVRRAARLRVCLPAVARGSALPEPCTVEIVDLTTGGARIRGLELPPLAQVTLDFTPPGREDPVSVRAVVAHGTHRAEMPWIGVTFRLVAMRGGR